MDYGACIALQPGAEAHLPVLAERGNTVVQSAHVRTAAALLAHVDACCPSVVAKAVVRERRAAAVAARRDAEQCSAAALAGLAAADVQALATRCCLSVGDMHAELLHQATVLVNRAAGGSRRRTSVPSAGMSRAQIGNECTADALRTWLAGEGVLSAAATRRLGKAALVDAVAEQLDK
jgi:hypothetical protein